MLKEYIEDIKYISKVASRDFQLMMTLKITYIPILMGIASSIANAWLELSLSNWIGIPVSLFMMVLFLLFITARRLRVKETPNITARMFQKSLITPEMHKGILDGMRPHNLFLAFKNTSYSKISDVKVKLMRVTINNHGFQEPQKPLNFLNHDEGAAISINSLDTEHTYIGSYESLNNKGTYALWDMKHTINSSVKFEILISSSSFVAITKRFELKQGAQGGIGMREIEG